MVFEKLKAMIAKQLGIAEEKITLYSRIDKDLGADSLDIVEMLMDVENTWDITIEDEDVQGFATVGDVVKYIESLIK